MSRRAAYASPTSPLLAPPLLMPYEIAEPVSGDIPPIEDEPPPIICADGTRLPRPPVLHPGDKWPIQYLQEKAMAEAAANGETPTYSGPTKSPDSIERYFDEARARREYSEARAAAKAEAAADAAAEEKRKPKKWRRKSRALGLEIETDLDDREVNTRYYLAICSRRLNLYEPVKGTMEYYRLLHRDTAKPIYWKDHDNPPVRPRPLIDQIRDRIDLIYFTAPAPPRHGTVPAPVPRRPGVFEVPVKESPVKETAAAHCISFKWLSRAVKRICGRRRRCGVERSIE